MTSVRFHCGGDTLSRGCSGAVIEPGKRAQSQMIQMVCNGVNGRVKPPVGGGVMRAEVLTLRAWISHKLAHLLVSRTKLQLTALASNLVRKLPARPQ